MSEPPSAKPSLTSGGIIRPLLSLAIPFAFANVFTVVNLAIDRMWVGRVGTDALAALGTAQATLAILVTLLMGMSIGTLAGVARSIGAQDLSRAHRYFGQGLMIGVGLGTIMLAFAVPLPALVMDFMQAEPEVAGPAAAYLRIGMWGMVIQGPLTVLTFSIQGAGQAKAAVKVAVVAPVINAALDPLLIFTLNMGLPGAAWATVIANACAVMVGFRLILNESTPLRLIRDAFKWRPEIVKSIAGVGLPGSLEHIVRTVASFSLIKIITVFGATVVSAYTSSMVMIMAVVFPGLAMGQATASLVGQNLGAGAPRRAWRTAWTAAGLYVLFMIVVGVGVYVFAEPIVRLFDRNPTVVTEGAILLRILVFCQPFLAVALVLSKAFGGAGNTLPPMIAATIAHLVVQIPLAWYLSEQFGAVGAYWAISTAFIIHGLLAGALFYRHTLKSAS